MILKWSEKYRPLIWTNYLTILDSEKCHSEPNGLSNYKQRIRINYCIQNKISENMWYYIILNIYAKMSCSNTTFYDRSRLIFLKAVMKKDIPERFSKQLSEYKKNDNGYKCWLYMLIKWFSDYVNWRWVYSRNPVKSSFCLLGRLRKVLWTDTYLKLPA